MRKVALKLLKPHEITSCTSCNPTQKRRWPVANRILVARGKDSTAQPKAKQPHHNVPNLRIFHLLALSTRSDLHTKFELVILTSFHVVLTIPRFSSYPYIIPRPTSPTIQRDRQLTPRLENTGSPMLNDRTAHQFQNLYTIPCSM
jgi:hypothetical protein